MGPEALQLGSLKGAGHGHRDVIGVTAEFLLIRKTYIQILVGRCRDCHRRPCHGARSVAARTIHGLFAVVAGAPDVLLEMLGKCVFELRIGDQRCVSLSSTTS